MERTELVARLQQVLGPDGVVHRPDELAIYEYDGAFDVHEPSVVVLPTRAEQVVEIVRLANEADVPIVPRGAGTGLSGGAVAKRGGIQVAMTRMNRILELDYRNRRALVEPGVINLDLSMATSPHGYYYVPDPSSQKACTIGGNVAENSGGPHCLAYGVTTNHVLALEVVLPSGELVWTGGPGLDTPGYDLTGVIVGSEGTLGIVTKALLRLTRLPEAVRVLLAQFDNVVDASNTVSAVIAQGIVPAAMEMMDRLVCQAVEEAYHVGFPPDVGAVLLIEVDGLGEGLDLAIERIAAICRDNAARSVRVAATAEERAALWNARKMAFGAMGRLAPSYYMQDGVVPRTKLPATLARVEAVSREYDLRIANVFHAGDGNLHPLILFDRRDQGAVERVLRAGVEILQTCIDMGGTISGEHGIGLEKKEQMALIFTADDLAAMARLKGSFNPRDLFNPDKIFPSRVSCAEVREVRQDSRHAALLAEYGH
ncbi:MAG TPA: FAD-linked oxidase C-terminal domain-containing protein [Chloroflexota bacterium]|nr:FAD-linked oxidase C-terminal domain-containing protein [Chloroflexota bacterium]